jgi:fluoroquinolone transport system permease protein
VSELARVLTLARKDARTVARDGFLLWLIAYPPVLCLGMRAVVPWVGLEGLGLWLAPAAVVLAPSLIGMMLGFALIEEREQNTWVLLRVLPLRERTLLFYVGALPFALALSLSLLCTALYGRTPSHAAGYLACVAVGSLTAPALALGMAALARDKIQGLALGKILSVASAAPLVAFVLAPAWQPLLYWSPWYWLYLGLLEAFARPGELAALGLPVWPSLPAWSLVAVPAAECLVLVGVAAAAVRRRMP